MRIVSVTKLLAAAAMSLPVFVAGCCPSDIGTCAAPTPKPVCAPVVAGGISYEPCPVATPDRPVTGYTEPKDIRVISVSGPVATSNAPTPPTRSISQSMPATKPSRSAAARRVIITPVIVGQPAPTPVVDNVSVGPGTADLVDGGPAALGLYDRPEMIAVSYPDLSPKELVNYAVGQHVGVPEPVTITEPTIFDTLTTP